MANKTEEIDRIHKLIREKQREQMELQLSEDIKTFLNADKVGQEIIKLCNQVLKLNPKDASMWYCKGQTLQGFNKKKEALDCFNKSLELNPKNIDAWNAKGCIFAFDRPKEALDCFNQALKLNPKGDYLTMILENIKTANRALRMERAGGITLKELKKVKAKELREKKKNNLSNRIKNYLKGKMGK